MDLRARLVACVVSVALLGLLPAAAGAAPGPTPASRWFGAEGGYMETLCWGTGSGCPGFSVDKGLGGGLSTWDSKKELRDPDGVSRPWPARTGNLLFLSAVPGGIPAYAYLSTVGSEGGTLRPGTVSFALRIHTLPSQPVVIYQHAGTFAEQTPAVTISLTPDGRLALLAAGVVIGVSQASFSTMRWHTLSVTYGPQDDTPIRLSLDGEVEVEGTLPLGGPSGHLNLGIVSPTSTPFALGIDDYVESRTFDAPLEGARINYLMPLGHAGTPGWEKAFHNPACKQLAENWQLISEDQRVTVNEQGTPLTCELAGAVTTTVDGAVDEYRLEGIPSRHKPSAGYARDVLAQPRPGEDILGVRVRMDAIIQSPDISKYLALRPGFVDGGIQVQDSLAYNNGGTGGYQTRWGASRSLRPDGSPWTSAALGDLTLRLDSGAGGGIRRTVGSLRLDYLWVPQT